jgi:hypothetical protein
VQDGEVSSVILDIDVFAPEPGCRGAVELEQRLAEMRWIKNRAFFGRISRALREVLS